MTTSNNNNKQDWINSTVDGFNPYARVPAALLLDPLLGPREFRVFICLALHANKAGVCSPGQERIAEMCGYFVKGVPDKSLVSKIIKNLRLRGWVKVIPQKTRDDTNTYVLKIAPVEDELREVTDRKKDSATFEAEKLDKSAQRLNEEEGFANDEEFFDYLNKEGKFAEPAQPAKKDPDDYTKEDCLEAIQLYNEGFDKDIPDEVLMRFGLKYPTVRDMY